MYICRAINSKGFICKEDVYVVHMSIECSDRTCIHVTKQDRTYHTAMYIGMYVHQSKSPCGITIIYGYSIVINNYYYCMYIIICIHIHSYVYAYYLLYH